MTPALREIAKLATQLAGELPPETLKLVATIVASSRDREDAKARLVHQVAQPHYRRLASQFLEQLDHRKLDSSSDAVAMSLFTAACAGQSYGQERSLELVWTGPDTSGMPFRRTEQAILEVLGSAKHKITVVSYAVYKIPHICAALVGAAGRGVRIDVIVETPDERAGKTEYDTLRALGESVAACSSVYYWPHDRRPTSGQHAGILHVKCVVADSRLLFLSSANLTEHAFTTNMELGLLVRGGSVPAQVDEHFQTLIRNGTLVAV